MMSSLERRGGDALDGRRREHPVARAGEHRLARLGLDRLRGRAERAGGVDHVVDDDGVLASTSPMMFITSLDVGRRAALVDDREAGAEALRVGARALDAAGVGRHDHRVAAKPQLAGRRSGPASRTGGRTGCRRSPGSGRRAGRSTARRSAPAAVSRSATSLADDRRARLALAVLPGVAEVGDDRDDRARPTRA